jgi:biotin operon repressor
LRSTTDIGAVKYDQLISKLHRLDAASKKGPWTKETLLIISNNPHVVSTELAAKLGRERMWLKLNIRKLKNLGLTISHDVGYEISPLGKVVLGRL